jgi:hypothetical protein
MIIPCFRCGKGIDTPDDTKADYVIAGDMIVREPREVLFALKQNKATLAKRTKIIEENTITLDSGEKVPPTEDFICSQFQDSEYDQVKIPNIEAGKAIGEDLVKVIAEMQEVNIQKTGIICPDCYKSTDLVIWGVHKKQE